MFLLLLFLFVFFVGGGWLIGKTIGGFLFRDEKSESLTFIDKSVHHHHYDNRTVIIDGDEFKNVLK
jgi:hypothetical protein